ncbi:MAG: AAA family ATPase [Gammaproteobacteria bacterium]|nr:AAA family ATPase [Gammaproteobacteria bacterium]
MIYITKKIINRLLNLQEQKNVQNIHYQSEGPSGYFDRFRYFVEGNPNAWRARDSEAPKSDIKPIIICNSFLTNRSLSLLEINLFNALFKNFVLYPWPGDRVSLFQTQPFTHVADLCERKNAINSATKENIEISLSEVGLSAHDFIILDYTNYQNLIRSLQIWSSFYPLKNPQFLDLTWHSLIDANDRDEILKSVDTKNIIMLKCNALNLEVLDWINIHFPNLTTLKFETIAIELESALQDAGYQLKRNKAQGRYQQWMKIPNQVINVDVKSTAPYAQATDPSNLSLIDCNFDQYVEKLSLNERNAVVNLVIYGVLTEIDLSLFPNLKRIEIHKTNTSKFDFSALPQLEEVLIENCEALNQVNFKDNQQIKNIKVQGCKLLNEIGEAYLPYLEGFIFKSLDNVNVNLNHYPSLKKLTSFAANLHLQGESRALEYLHQANDNLSLPNFSLSSMKVIEWHDCLLPQQLQLIDNEQLNFLTIHYSSLESAVRIHTLDLKNLSALKKLHLFNLSQMQKLHLENLSALQIVDIGYDNQLVGTKDVVILHCDQLKTLKIDTKNCDRLILQDLPSLTSLHILNFSQLGVTQLKHLPSVKNLIIDSAVGLDFIDFNNLENIETLTLINACDLEKIDLSKFIHLKYITLDKCNALKELILPLATTLEVLHIDSCKNLLTIDNLDSTSLTNLSINNCDRLAKIKLEGSNHLQYLKLNNLPELQSVNLSNKPYLKKVKILNSGSDIQIEETPQLRKLFLVNTLNALKVTLNGCKALKNLICISEQDSQILNLSQCTSLATATLSMPNEAQHILNLPQQCLWEKISAANISSSINTDNNVRHSFTDQELKLNHSNKISATSIMSSTMLNANIPVSAYTGKPKPYHAEGNLKFTLTEKDPVDCNHYRLNIIDQVQWIKGKLVFVNKIEPTVLEFLPGSHPHFTSHDVNNLTEKVKRNASEGFGYFEGEVASSMWIPLASQETMSEPPMVKCNPQNAIECYWHPVHKQAYARLKPQIETQHIEILYEYKKNNNYYYPEGEAVTQNHKLIPQVLIDNINALQSVIKDDHDLSFIFNPKLSISKKLELLKLYCLRFHETDQETNNKLSDIDTFIGQMINQEGWCSHRGQVYMVLARYLGVPARMIASEQHVYCEVPFQGRSLQWALIDLNGTARLDLTPLDQRTNTLLSQSQKGNLHFSKKKTDFLKRLKNYLFKPFSIHQSQSLKSSQSKKNCDQLKNYYYAQFLQWVEPEVLLNIPTLIEKRQPLAPLIEIPAGYSAVDVNLLLTNSFQELGYSVFKNYCYIDSAEEFAHYLHPYQFSGGERKKIAGPLQSIIERGGIIVVNWSNFSPEEIASYKSICDARPTLLGNPVNSQVQVIGLIQKNTLTCSAFLSRTKPYTLSTPLIEKMVQHRNEPVIDGNNTITIDLFHSVNWQKYLLGDIQFKDKKILLNEGALIKAIRNNKSIIIYNAPKNNAKFNLLMRRLQDEKVLHFNGKLLYLQNQTIISNQERTLKSHLDNVKINTTAYPLDRKPIYLGLYNLHECYEQLQVRADSHSIHELPGLLAEYNTQKNFFYLTESLPLSDWQELLVYIEENFPKQQFEFVLSDGVAIEKVAYASPTLRDKKSSHIWMSNDPDYTAQQLQIQSSKPTFIIDITPKTSYTDLIAKLNIEANNSGEQFDFSFDFQDAYLALIKGHNIILNGEISPLLYHELLPLFSGDSIKINGEAKLLPGQLMLVLPQLKNNSVGASAQKVNVSLEDYKAMFPTTQWPTLDKIACFYQRVDRIPHRGIGLPPRPALTFASITRFLNKLSHPDKIGRNPIKGLFLYDYPKESATFAYINVMGKYLFGNQSDDIVKQRKLRKLFQHYNIRHLDDVENHVWQILNCLSPKKIKTILGANLDESINYPKVSHATLEAIWQAIIEVLANRYNDEPDLFKTENHFNRLLHDEKIPIIFLKGEAGTGKTRSYKKIKKRVQFPCFEGEDGLVAWLKQTPTCPTVLFLDEANMEKPGTWNFLKGLMRKDKVVYYHGKKYELSSFHKVVITGNPESYPGRFYHSIFQDSAETIWFSMPDDCFIKDNILKKKLTEFNLNKEHYIDALLNTYHLIAKLHPTFIFSLRDLKNLVMRFCVLMQTHSDSIDHWQDYIFRAACAEFAGTIQDTNARNLFVSKLRPHGSQLFLHSDSHSPLIFIASHTGLPSDAAMLLESLEQDLLLRQFALQNAAVHKHCYYKKGVLLIGPPGVGKSFLLKTLLEHHGFHPDAPLSSQKYYEISVAKEKDIAKTLTRAFHEGAIVILDEINLDNTLEKLLNQLLTGRDLKGQRADHPGFMIMASQNPNYFAGRQSNSKSLYNRLSVRHFDSFSVTALTQIARNHHIPHPAAFAKAFKQCELTYPARATLRTYYNFANTFFNNKKRKADLTLPSVHRMRVNSKA